MGMRKLLSYCKLCMFNGAFRPTDDFLRHVVLAPWKCVSFPVQIHCPPHYVGHTFLSLRSNRHKAPVIGTVEKFSHHVFMFGGRIKVMLPDCAFQSAVLSWHWWGCFCFNWSSNEYSNLTLGIFMETLVRVRHEPAWILIWLCSGIGHLGLENLCLLKVPYFGAWNFAKLPWLVLQGELFNALNRRWAWHCGSEGSNGID